MTLEELSFVTPFKSKIKQKNCLIHGAVLNFVMEFDEAHYKVSFSNSSFANKSNYSQCFLYFKNPTRGNKNQIISGHFALKTTEKKAEKAQIKMSFGVENNKKAVQYFHIE